MKYLLSVLFVLPFLIGAQVVTPGNEPCGTDELTRALWKENPELEKAYYLNFANMQSMNKDGDEEEEEVDTLTYYIPVVFHILHEYGSENISDAQIYRQMEIINEEFSLQNADAANIIPEFQEIAANTKIQFVLASKDPVGNPTSGIVRHFTHETNNGDQFSKLNQWPRSRYLNVWIARNLYNPGVAGYSQFPSNVEGALAYMDGIMQKHDYTGDNGTSNPGRAQTLTHEAGHYLGLPHVWGFNNDPGQGCGDDGIDDTPMTRGFSVCPLNFPSSYPQNAMICDNTVIENFQNYMDYSYCSNMFTAGQAKYMRNVLKAETAQRSTLVSETNLQNSAPEGVVFDPIADFFTTNQRVVTTMGQSVQFKNHSWNIVTSNPTYTWTFEDANIETSNDVNPTVVFNDHGWKTVSLTVEDNGRTHTVTKEDFIWVAPSWAMYGGGPISFDFDPADPGFWIVENPQEYSYYWNVRSDAGKNGTGGIFLDMSNQHANPLPYSPEFFFSQRRGGSKSSFYSLPLDLTALESGEVSFEYAAATEGTTAEEISERLRVYVSTDKGITWDLRANLGGVDLINNGTGWDSFYPSSTTVWSTFTFAIPSNSLVDHVQLKFEYTASDHSNNIAIDNIQINGTVGIEGQTDISKISVYPNPSSKEDGWNVSYEVADWGGANAAIYDISGREVSSTVLPKTEATANIKLNDNAANGIYILKIYKGDKSIQKKLILK